MATTFKIAATILTATLILTASGLRAQATVTPSKAAEPIAQTGNARTVALTVAGHDLRVSGGEASDACAVLLGLSLRTTPLPGGARLLIDPLAILTIGRLDAKGELHLLLGYDAKMLDKIRYHFQAVTVGQLDGAFRATNVGTLDFTKL